MSRRITLSKGEVFGELTVLDGDVSVNGSKKVHARCKCSCGAIAVKVVSDIRRGVTRSCGCLRKDVLKKNAYIHTTKLIKRRYGMLTLIADNGDKNGKGEYISRFMCDCGNDVVLSNLRVIQGKAKSCGCLRDAMLSVGIKNYRGGYE